MKSDRSFWWVASQYQTILPPSISISARGDGSDDVLVWFALAPRARNPARSIPAAHAALRTHGGISAALQKPPKPKTHASQTNVLRGPLGSKGSTKSCCCLQASGVEALPAVEPRLLPAQGTDSAGSGMASGRVGGNALPSAQREATRKVL